MRHHFIINPAAGKGNRTEELREKITAVCSSRNADYRIYYTKCVGDATEYVRKTMEEGDMRHRFYACGGDGTLKELINGAPGNKNAEFGLIPIGTGNDFWRNFSDGDAFFDIDRQLDGECELIDAIRFNGKYCINMINIGFDCNVVASVARIKRRRYIPEKLAYIAGVIENMFKKFGTQMKLTLSDGTVIDRPLMLTAISGGGYCGGGFHSSPKASLQDGLIDLCIVKKVTRPQFISLVGLYKKGTYLDSEKGRKTINYLHSKSVKIEFEHPTNICADGEIESVSSVNIESAPSSVLFSIPKGSELIAKASSEEQALAGVTIL